MDCLFCHRPTSKDGRSSDPNWDILYCSGCDATFNIDISTGKVASYYFMHNNYRAVFWLLDEWDGRKEDPQVQIFHCPPPPNGGWHLVKTIKFLPDITPANFPAKLKTILTYM